MVSSFDFLSFCYSVSMVSDIKLLQYDQFPKTNIAVLPFSRFWRRQGHGVLYYAGLGWRVKFSRTLQLCLSVVQHPVSVIIRSCADASGDSSVLLHHHHLHESVTQHQEEQFAVVQAGRAYPEAYRAHMPGQILLRLTGFFRTLVQRRVSDSVAPGSDQFPKLLWQFHCLIMILPW